MRTLRIMAVFLSGTILGACAINGASGLDLSGLGKFGDLIQEIRAGTQKGIDEAVKAVRAAKVTYCATVPLALRHTARDLANQPGEPVIAILCPGDPDYPET